MRFPLRQFGRRIHAIRTIRPNACTAGNTTVDEMGHLCLQVLPKGPRDRRVELEEALLRDRLEKYPTDFEAHLHRGRFGLARFDPSGALAELQIAVRGEPRIRKRTTCSGRRCWLWGATAKRSISSGWR